MNARVLVGAACLLTIFFVPVATADHCPNDNTPYAVACRQYHVVTGPVNDLSGTIFGLADRVVEWPGPLAAWATSCPPNLNNIPGSAGCWLAHPVPPLP